MHQRQEEKKEVEYYTGKLIKCDRQKWLVHVILLEVGKKGTADIATKMAAVFHISEMFYSIGFHTKLSQTFLPSFAENTELDQKMSSK